MAGPIPVLLLTRPERQSRAFLAECEARLGDSLSAIVSPVMQIESVQHQVNFDHYRTLIVTSQNAFGSINQSIAGRSVVTVGQRTALRATELGASAVCLGDTVEALLESAENIEGPAVHLRGVHSRGALAKRLSDYGLRTDECVVYDQVANPLSGLAVDALAKGTAIVPVFSPRTARLVSEYPVHDATKIIFISPTAQQVWTGLGQLTVAERPDKAAMLDEVVRAF